MTKTLQKPQNKDPNLLPQEFNFNHK